MKNDTLEKILNIGIAFSKEKNRERLLDQILTAAMDITNCDGGTLYMNNGDALEFRIRSPARRESTGAEKTVRSHCRRCP